MPAVSTSTRSKPAWRIELDDVLQHRRGGEVLAARRQRAHEHRRCARASSCGCDRRAARRRERRRVGSIATTAIWRSGKARTKRCSSSSVSELLPAPPVPVMPMTGAARLPRASAWRICSAARSSPCPPSSAVMLRAMCAWSRALSGPKAYARPLRRAHAREHVLDHALEAEPASVLGGVDLLDAVALERRRSRPARSCRRRRR